jgi:hypothetical protein
MGLLLMVRLQFLDFEPPYETILMAELTPHIMQSNLPQLVYGHTLLPLIFNSGHEVLGNIIIIIIIIIIIMSF